MPATLFNSGLLIRPATKLSQLSIDADKVWPFVAGTNVVAPSPNTPLGGGIDAYVKLMLHMDGLDGGVIFTDSEIPPTKVVTPHGNAQTKIAIKKFGTASGNFDGIDSWIDITPASDDFKFGAGDFTVDFWCYPTSFAADRAIYDNLVTGGVGARNDAFLLVIENGTGKLKLFRSSGYSGATVNVLNLNAWNHIAVENISGVFKFFINGVLDATTTNVPNLTSGGFVVGKYADVGGGYFVGYEDEFRISKGIARWTASFTPPVFAYSVNPLNPTMTTDSITVLSETSATLNGTVSVVNDTNITDRGFVWDTISHADPGQVDPSLSGYAHYHKDSGIFGAGVFNYTAIGLTAFRTYYIRAFAKNDAGFWSYGGEQAQIIGITYGITDVKQLATGMQKGDLLYSDGTKLVRISPGSIGTNLIGQDIGNPPIFGYPP